MQGNIGRASQEDQCGAGAGRGPAGALPRCALLRASAHARIGTAMCMLPHDSMLPGSSSFFRCSLSVTAPEVVVAHCGGLHASGRSLCSLSGAAIQKFDLHIRNCSICLGPTTQHCSMRRHCQCFAADLRLRVSCRSSCSSRVNCCDNVPHARCLTVDPAWMVVCVLSADSRA